MNRTAIEWCDYTNNPVTGCTRNCPYCYARSMAYRQKGRNGYPEDNPFFPTLHFNMLTRPDRVKKPAKIFTVSMGELFDRDVPDVWRYLVFNSMRYNPHHTFLVLTKQVNNMVNYLERKQWNIPDNLWLGISQDGKTTNDDDLEFFRCLDVIPRKFVSFEPLLGPVCTNLYGIDWVIIGAQTGPRANQPRKEWVQSIGSEALSWDIPIFIKDNVNMSEADRLQEWPEGMK